MYSVAAMPKHGYASENKTVLTAEDFSKMCGPVAEHAHMKHFDFVVKCTACKVNTKYRCGKKFFGSTHVPETGLLRNDHRFVTFVNPCIVTGPSDAHRSALAKSGGGRQVATNPRDWHTLFHMCHVNAACEQFSDLPADFKAVLAKKAPRFEECWKNYNAAKDSTGDYQKDDALFERAKRFMDLLPTQPAPSKCRPHKKRRADGGVASALPEAGEQPASAHSAVNAGAAVRQSQDPHEQLFDGAALLYMFQTGFHEGVRQGQDTTRTAVEEPASATDVMNEFHDFFGLDA